MGNGATLLDHLGMDREDRRGGGGGREEQKDIEGDGEEGERKRKDGGMRIKGGV